MRMKLPPVVIVVSIQLMLGATAMASENVKTVRSLQHWTGPGERAAATLSVVEYSCAQKARRVFVDLGSPGDRWILEAYVSPTTGELRHSLRHGSGDWQLDMVDHYDKTVEIPSPYAYGDSLFWQKLADAGPVERERTLTVNGSKVVQSSGSGRFMDFESDEKGFSSEDLASLRQQGLPASVQADLRSLLLFMEAEQVKSGVLGRFLPLVRFVWNNLGTAEQEKGVTTPVVQWKRVDTQAFGGDQEMTQGELDLLGQFTGFEDSRDPLVGLHAPSDGGCPSSTKPPAPCPAGLESREARALEASRSSPRPRCRG